LSCAALTWPQKGHGTTGAGGVSCGPAEAAKVSRLVTGEYALVLMPETGFYPEALAFKAF